MDHDLRMERRRVRLFFAGLLVISAALDIVGALLVHRQTRSEVLETLLPATVTLGGRAGAPAQPDQLLGSQLHLAPGRAWSVELSLGGGRGVRRVYAPRSDRACAGRPHRAARDRPPSHS